MVYTWDHVKEGMRMFSRHMKVAGKNFTRFEGNDVDICNQILKKLFNGTYFKTSLGHYPGFYARDFGMMVIPLLDLGYRKEVISTLDYALNIYLKQGGIKTLINTKHKAMDFPNVYSIDSFAYMLRAVAIVNDADLIKKYESFLQKEVYRFHKKAIHNISGEVRRKVHFGGMRDHSKRDSSCYDTVMAAVVSREADYLGLKNPMRNFNFKKHLLDNYWLDNYFRDDMSSFTLTADANIFPFWLGIIDDEKKLLQTIVSIKQSNLEKPFPIKYVSNKNLKGKTILAEKFVPGWEADAIWPMSGLPYIDILGDVDKKSAKAHLDRFKRLIEKYGTFLEVYDKYGKPFVSSVYSSDEGMIWVALYLYLKKRFK